MDARAAPVDWPRGTGEMARLIRERDWSATPLGPREAWPDRLRGLVDLMLGSRSLMCLMWGPEAHLLYNEPYARSIDGFHPEALGRSAFAIWPGQAPIFGPPFARALAGEEAQVREQHLRLPQRDGSRLEGWFDATYTPVPDGAGSVAGVLVSLSEVTERVLASRQRDAAEASLRESEERYRAIFDSINEGFSLLDVQFDAEGRAVDVIIRDANPAQDRIDGVRALIGRSVREVLPDIEPKWFERYGHVARTGEPAHFEDWSEANQRWYEVDATRVGGPGSALVAIVYSDVTEGRRAAEVLRASERRQSFLLRLSDALRPLSDPVEVQTTAMRLVAEHLGVMRASYFELEEDGDTFHLAARFEQDATPMPERMRLSDFSPALGEAYRSGRTLMVSDTSVLGEFVEDPEPYAAIGVGAWAAVPLMREGRLVAWIGVHAPASREWSAADLQVLDDVAERTWGAVERTRAEAALRMSEERLQVLVGELQHRTRNLMTVVLSVLKRTHRDSTSQEDLAATLRDRYGALARVNSLLSRLHESDRVTFDELVRAELQAMGAVDADGWGPQVILDGPKGVRLRSSTVQTLALALHELATNASKYGALAQREGRLALRWRRRVVNREARLHVEWSETGIVVPDPEGASQGTGFGRELIERALPHQLGAETTYVLATDGVSCTIDLPLSSKEVTTDA